MLSILLHSACTIWLTPKLGGASAKQKKNMLSILLHSACTIWLTPKLGGASAKQKKNMLFFCFALGLH